MKILFLNVTIIFLMSIVSVESNDLWKVKRFEEFSIDDYELLVNEYKYSSREINILFGIALLNEQVSITPKYSIEVSLEIDSISFVGIYRNEKIYYLKGGPINRSLPKYGGQLKLEYHYNNELILLEYSLYEEGRVTEKLIYKNSKVQFEKYFDDRIQCEYIDEEPLEKVVGEKLIIGRSSEGDTIITFDPFAYEEWIQVIYPIESKRIGRWIWYDKDGNITKSKDFN